MAPDVALRVVAATPPAKPNKGAVRWVKLRPCMGRGAAGAAAEWGDTGRAFTGAERPIMAPARPGSEGICCAVRCQPPATLLRPFALWRGPRSVSHDASFARHRWAEA